jgi:hypothetical protein
MRFKSLLTLISFSVAHAWPLNITIYDTHPNQVRYHPDTICANYHRNWFYRLTCLERYKAWKRVYWDDNQSNQSADLATMHQSVNHHLVELSIDFHGKFTTIVYLVLYCPVMLKFVDLVDLDRNGYLDLRIPAKGFTSSSG